MRSNRSDLFKILFVMAILMALFVPIDAFAASNNIFDVIQAKMLSTAKDIRRIVYVIAGFGLIMFSVLAIFNKISFKHLSYIMISLSLLAMMTPFINYFSGAGLDESDFNRGDYLKADTFASSNAGSLVNNPAGTPQDPGGIFGIGSPDPNSPNYNPKLDPNSSEYDPTYGIEASVVTAEGSVPSLKLPNQVVSGIADPGIAPILGTGSETGAESKKTFGEVLNNTVEKGQKFVDNVHNGIDAAENLVYAAGAAAAGWEKAGEILNSDASGWEKLGGLVSVTRSTTDDVGSSISHVLDDASAVTGYLGWEGASNWLDKKDNDVDRNRGSIYGVVGAVGDVVDLAYDAESAADRLGVSKRAQEEKAQAKNASSNTGGASTDTSRANTGSYSGSSSTVPVVRNDPVNVYDNPGDRGAGSAYISREVDVVGSVVTNPGVTNPSVNNPGIANPVIVNPVGNNPVIANPVVTLPTITGPVVTSPTNPTINAPTVTGPTVTGPATNVPTIKLPVVDGSTTGDSVSNDNAATNPATAPVATRPVITRPTTSVGGGDSANGSVGRVANPAPVNSARPVIFKSTGTVATTDTLR